jgi:hypothetical protein
LYKLIRKELANSVFPPKNKKSSSNSKAEGIKLKGGVMLATKCDFARISNEHVCYALCHTLKYLILGCECLL